MIFADRPAPDLGLILAHFDETDIDVRKITGYVEPVRATAPSSFIINQHCLSVAKRTVQAAFVETFGISLHIDPTEFSGRAVRKSNENACHDGVLVEFPIAPEEVDRDFIYEKFIDTSWKPGYALTIRVPVVGDEIPFVFRYWRDVAECFGDEKSFVEPSRASDEFSAEEIAKIFAMVRRMGVDFGMLDVLRSTVDGQIYVVDVNSTPTGPSPAVRTKARLRAMAELSDSFRRQFIQQEYSRLQTARVPPPGAHSVLEGRG